MTDAVSSNENASAPTRDISPEYSPMSALDDFMIHTTAMPVRVMHTTDPRAYERNWFTCQDRTGDLFVVTGLGFYPNLNTAEAYAVVNLRGRLYSLHAHRRLGDNRMNMRVGPLNFAIVQSFKHWRLTLDENKFGIAYELNWYDTKRAVFRHGFLSRPDRSMSPIPPDDTSGYETFGCVEGWVTVDGERFVITPTVYCGARDHHWGTREGVGGKGHMRNPEAGVMPFCNQYVEFKDWSIFGIRAFYNVGDPRPGAGSFLMEKRALKLRFDPETRLFTEGLVTQHLDSGEAKEMHFRRLGHQTAYLRCGMYGQPNGGTPDGDLWHGMYVGDDVIGGGIYDTTKPEVRSLLTGINDHHCEVSCDTETTVGIVEISEPHMYERCRRGKGPNKLWE